MTNDKLNTEIAARKGGRLGHYEPLPETDARFSTECVYQWVSYDYLHDGAKTWEALEELPNLGLNTQPGGRNWIACGDGFMGSQFDKFPDLAHGVWVLWLMWQEQLAWQRLA